MWADAGEMFGKIVCVRGRDFPRRWVGSFTFWGNVLCRERIFAYISAVDETDVWA